jgi:glycosyltransferase involved in cell wall biosynthesis
VLVSPGVNALDARAIGVHIVFAKFWERVKENVTRDLANLGSVSRAANRMMWWAVIRRLEAWVYSGPATLWAASTEDARQLELRFGRPLGSVPVVPHGVDTKRFSAKERKRRRAEARERLGVAGAQVCLVIGNDMYKKGVDTAIAALPMLPADVTLAVAGNVDGPAVREIAREHGVVERVLLWPHTKQVVDYYGAADLFLAPSREDAFHMPALEALACELPSVISKSAGVAELLEDGRHALLMSDPTDAAELSKLVTRLLREPDLAGRLAREGRALAERCSWDANADATAALVEREIVTPRVIVLAEDPAGSGGIQHATRTLLTSLSHLYGAERVGLLQVLDRGVDKPTYRILHHGTRTAAGASVRPSVVASVRYRLAAMRAALRWRGRNLLIIAAQVHLAPAAHAAASVSGMPYAVWCHGVESLGPLDSPVNLALKEADAVFTADSLSAALIEQLAGLPRNRVHVLPYGLPFGHKASHPTAKRRPTVLTMARLSPEDAYQGIDTLICAWPQVAARVPEAQLEVIGDGTDRPRLMKLAEALGLNGGIRFRGRVSDDDLHDAFVRAGVFAMPARRETAKNVRENGLRLIFAEAGAAGVPVVAGGLGAEASEWVEDEIGLIVDSDDPIEIADAIVRLLTDTDLAGRLGRGGRIRAESGFSYSSFERNVDALVRSLAGPAPGAPPGIPE